jgi:hypothetical protein
MTAEVNLWEIDDGPAAEGRPTTNLELFGVQKTMGRGGERKVVEALITINESLIFAPPRGGTGSNYDYYLVRLPFTAHPLSGGRSYNSLELRVKLGDPETMGFVLIPNAVVTEEDVKRTYDISAEFGRAGVKLGGGGSYVVSFKHIVPIVRAFGESSQEFYWQFERTKAGPLLLGDHSTLVILRVLKGSSIITSELYAEGLIESRFPWLGKQEVFSDHKQVKWDLANAEPFDAIPWTKSEITEFAKSPLTLVPDKR